MGIPIADSFILGSQIPIDRREQVNTYIDLQNIPISQRYLGLKTYVISEQKYYYLKDDLNTWVEFNSGSSQETTSSYTVGVGGIQQYQVVYISSANTILPADCNNPTNNRIVGVAIETGLEGDIIKVKKTGNIVNPSWVGFYITGDEVFLGNAGNITKTDNSNNTVGFIQKVGFFDNDDGSLVLNFEDSVLL